MKVSKRGQITIPKGFRDHFGMNCGIEVEITPMDSGLLIRKKTKDQHPVERVYGILDCSGNTDGYIEEVRGR